MRLIKLTDSRGHSQSHVYVSADQIVHILDIGTERIISTPIPGARLNVKETAEEIERLANSSSETPINYRHILAFIHWDQDNAIRFLGRSIHDKIDAFISETRNV